MRATAARRLRHAIASSYLDQHPMHTAAFIVVGGALAVGALVGLAFVAGPEEVVSRLVHPHLIWLPIALGASVASYLGYMLAYRECACAGSGPDLPLTHVGALVAGGFGLFIPRGGFALDVDALELAGLPRREAQVRTMSLGTLEYAVLAPVAFAISLLLLATGVHRVGVPLAGAGAVEMMLPFALMWMGIALPAAIVCVFVYRVFNLWLPLAPAAAAVFALRRSTQSARA